MKKNSKKWSVADVVDYEYFLAGQESLNAPEGDPASRKWFLEQQDPSKAFSARILLKKWLDWQKKRENSQKNTPGTVFRLTDGVIIAFLMVFGTVFGFGIAQGVLYYTGKQAINLFVCYGLLVVFPLAMSIFSIFSMIFRKTRLKTAFGDVFRRKIEWFYRQIGRFFSGKQLLTQQAFTGFLRTRLDLYRGLPGWFLMLRMQLFAFFCQFGLFLAVFLRGWVADMAFAWQTSANISPETIYNLAFRMSFGWRWLVSEPLAHPTLGQVAGSQVTLKDGLGGLANSDLTAWWPFLCWSILFYAVLPRLLLFLFAWVGESVALRRIAFDDMASRKLLRTMTSASLSIRDDAPAYAGAPDQQPMAPPGDAPATDRPATLLIPEECAAPADLPALARALEGHLGITIQQNENVLLDEDDDRALLQRLGDGENNVIIVLEGWKPCLESDLHYLRVLRRAIGNRLLFVALTGRPDKDGNHALLDDEHFHIWNQRLATLRDPRLEAFAIGPGDAP